jgi:xanthine dehydrogenase YagS FAD-binding subunit
MSPFDYRRPASLDEAIALLNTPGAWALGGGTDLLPLVRDAIVHPSLLVDLRRLPAATEVTWMPDGGVRIGAAARIAHLARHPELARAFPLFTESCAAVGSEALRTMGTLGGNLCQRPRCWYFRHGFSCHKNGGAGCPAATGEHQYHAILREPRGDGSPCIAVHPSDPAVALTALDAVVHVSGRDGTRDVAIADFFTGTGGSAGSETSLAPGEVVTAVTLPGSARGGRQRYEKVIQRGAFDFALVSLAALKRPDGEVRLVLGGVALRPWRVTDSIEEDVGSGGLSDDDIETLAARALYDATPLPGNAYKVEMASAVLRRGIAFLEGR